MMCVAIAFRNVGMAVPMVNDIPVSNAKVQVCMQILVFL
jgi:hypothetical protein